MQQQQRQQQRLEQWQHQQLEALEEARGWLTLTPLPPALLQRQKHAATAAGRGLPPCPRATRPIGWSAQRQRRGLRQARLR